jgi:hypothetical protein
MNESGEDIRQRNDFERKRGFPDEVRISQNAAWGAVKALAEKIEDDQAAEKSQSEFHAASGNGKAPLGLENHGKDESKNSQEQKGIEQRPE